MTTTILIGFYLLAGAFIFTYTFIPVLRVKSYYAHKVLNEDSCVFATCAIFFTVMWAPIFILSFVIGACTIAYKFFKGEL